IAYGSEAGDMDAFLEKAVKKMCSDTYFIARTKNSLERIQSLGLTGQLGTDAAWRFASSSKTQWAKDTLKACGWDGHMPLLGIAPINPFWWPVKPALFKWLKAGITGDHSLQFQLWYFYSWSDERRRQFENYLDAIADAVNKFTKEHPCFIVILGMERLDADACNKLQARLCAPSAVFLSTDHDGYEMSALLRQLSFLITSRYHARVLSMNAEVPSIAVSMDERLDNIMQDTNMTQYQLIHSDDPELSQKLMNGLNYIDSHEEQIRKETSSQLAQAQSTMDGMEDFLIDWLHSNEDMK
ncbi:MAG: polysaccharide pyruvyl transferase family protein, partial [Eggerthellaceae bacterium]|nr:polysaccharide pyruvyl transferase family protein [Eggerthellaceae bacterium]